MAVPALQYGIGNSASTTLSVAASNSDTSMTITSDTNFAAKSGEGMVIIDESQSTEELVYSASKTGATLSTPLVNRGLEGGSAQAHAINATVKGILTVGMWNDLIDALVDNLLDQTTGATKTGIALTSPKITTGINDANNNELFKVTATGSAVNEFTVANAAASGNPTLSVTGSDTDIDVSLTPKGSGKVNVTAGDLNLATGANIQVNDTDVKRGIYVPASAMYGATTSGAATGQYESSTNKVNVRVLDFDTSADEYACFNIPAPDYWDLSTVTAQFHWTAASGSDTVCWGLQGLARSNDDALDTAYGTGQTATDTLITANDEHITSATSAITIGGTPAKGDMLYFRIYRDVSEDTLAVDARLLGVRIKFGISQYDDQ